MLSGMVDGVRMDLRGGTVRMEAEVGCEDFDDVDYILRHMKGGVDHELEN